MIQRESLKTKTKSEYKLNFSDALNLYVGIFIVAIVFIMCVVSFFEEKKGVEVVRAFQTLMPTSCQVIRDGKEVSFFFLMRY